MLKMTEFIDKIDYFNDHLLLNKAGSVHKMDIFNDIHNQINTLNVGFDVLIFAKYYTILFEFDIFGSKMIGWLRRRNHL
ncbi:unnamed protein product [Paramecium primaurelia]|uniref:Uncharacterized protein n=1 Tax=Paramecium primaurelia TaxID=5886 RepID=A0A8S1QTJ3_PARPR|nr:unnamed protein product [Paramecium primaurelia]